MNPDDGEFVASLDFAKCGGLVPTVVCDARDGHPRMLAYSTRESLVAALTQRAGIYWSRSRQRIWRKGESSGNVQRLVRAVADCDRDALVFYVEQQGPTCHSGNPTCFADASEFSLYDLEERIAQRALHGSADSYTRRLLDGDALLRAKLMEEAAELARAESADDVVWECADMLYFTLVKMRAAGVGLDRVVAELHRRAG